MDGPDEAKPGVLDRLQRRKLGESAAEGERRLRPHAGIIALQREVRELRLQQSDER